MPFTVAAPSFVVPDTVAGNCRFLRGLFPEVGLCLYETGACLAYGPDDLPAEAPPNLTFHAHLPLDLPWGRGPEAAARAALAVAAKVAHLEPRCYVLHPPATPDELARFARLWTGAGHTPGGLLLENVEGNDLSAVLDAAHGLGLGLCLDLGHLMAYEQHFLPQAVDWERVRMLHVYAPWKLETRPEDRKGHRHLPLMELDADGQTLLQTLVRSLRPGGTVTLEVFQKRGLMDSARLLAEWTALWNPA
ncbi:cobamide remodeling phosphodiesterase CbiR [Desulfocurvus sp. DL9XJH121]